MPSSAALTPTNLSARARRRRSRRPSGSTRATIRSIAAVNRRPVNPVPPSTGGANTCSSNKRSTSSINSSPTFAGADSINETREKSNSPRAIAARVRCSRVLRANPNPMSFPAAARPIVSTAPTSDSASSCADDVHAPPSACSVLRRVKNSATTASFRSTSIASHACNSAIRSTRAQSVSDHSAAPSNRKSHPRIEHSPPYSKLCSETMATVKSVGKVRILTEISGRLSFWL